MRPVYGCDKIQYGKYDILTMLIHPGDPGYDSDIKELFIPDKEAMDIFDNLP